MRRTYLSIAVISFLFGCLCIWGMMQVTLQGPVLLAFLVPAAIAFYASLQAFLSALFKQNTVEIDLLTAFFRLFKI